MMRWLTLFVRSFRFKVARNRYLIVLFTTSVLLFVWRNNASTQVSNRPTHHQKRPIKRILLWNSPHRIEAAAFGTGHEAFIDAKCKVSDCEIIVNSTDLWSIVVASQFRLLRLFDAILVNVHDLPYSFLPPARIGKYRRLEHQRVVFFTQESPTTMNLQLDKLDGIFNWTMTYRLNSDVQLLYGRTKKRTVPLRPRDLAPVIKRKRKKVAWMVSHCKTQSHREDYAAQLKKYIPVDVYGKCGTFSCPRNEEHWVSHPKCYAKLAANYKFYLAYENSFCTDYVTEKFFNTLQHDIVPIVLGGADYSRIAPPHSFIDASQFESARHLADYLHKLDADDDLYAEYFKWKTDYRIEAGFAQMARHGFCDLCAKLHNNDEPIQHYDSLAPEWAVEKQCFNRPPP